MHDRWPRGVSRTCIPVLCSLPQSCLIIPSQSRLECNRRGLRRVRSAQERQFDRSITAFGGCCALASVLSNSGGELELLLLVRLHRGAHAHHLAEQLLERRPRARRRRRHHKLRRPDIDAGALFSLSFLPLPAGARRSSPCSPWWGRPSRTWAGGLCRRRCRGCPPGSGRYRSSRRPGRRRLVLECSSPVCRSVSARRENRSADLFSVRLFSGGFAAGVVLER